MMEYKKIHKILTQFRNRTGEEVVYLADVPKQID